MQKYFIVLVLLIPLTNVRLLSAEPTNPDIECAAYWQLKSIALRQDHSIASAKAAADFQQKYVKAKEQLKVRHGAQTFTEMFYQAMQIMLAKIGGDTKNHPALDAEYYNACPIDVKKGLNT